MPRYFFLFVYISSYFTLKFNLYQVSSLHTTFQYWCAQPNRLIHKNLLLIKLQEGNDILKVCLQSILLEHSQNENFHCLSIFPNYIPFSVFLLIILYFQVFANIKHLNFLHLCQRYFHHQFHLSSANFDQDWFMDLSSQESALKFGFHLLNIPHFFSNLLFLYWFVNSHKYLFKDCDS